jgi:hypothetical protein
MHIFQYLLNYKMMYQNANGMPYKLQLKMHIFPYQLAHLTGLSPGIKLQGQ